MTDNFLLELERAARRAAAQVWPELMARQGPIHRAIAELSAYYNSDRSITAAAPDGPEHHLARLLFFTLADAPKVTFPLGELKSRGLLPSRDLRVLDVGCGFGSMFLGLMGFLAGQDPCPSLLVDAVDRDQVALALLPRLLTELPGGPAVTLKAQHADLAHDPRLAGPYDLILAGNVFNELAPKRHHPLALELLQKLHPDGALIIIEPALRSTSRQLLSLRGELLTGQQAHVFAPCTHQAPCPALIDPQDWCHESRTSAQPPELRRLAAATRLRRKDTKWSYLTLNHTGSNINGGDPTLARAVSAPLKSKGKREIFICSGGGRHKVTLLNRHRSAANEGFREARRGCLVQLEGAEAEAAPPQLDSATSVRIEDPSVE